MKKTILFILITFTILGCGGSDGGGDAPTPASLTRIELNGSDIAREAVINVCAGNMYTFELYLNNPNANITSIWLHETYPDNSVVDAQIHDSSMPDIVYGVIDLIPEPPYGRYKEVVEVNSLDGSSYFTFYADLANCASRQIYTTTEEQPHIGILEAFSE